MTIRYGKWVIRVYMVEDLDTELCVLLFEIQDERSTILGRQDFCQGPNRFPLIR